MAEKQLTKKEKVLICATIAGAGYFGIKYFKQKAHVSKLEHSSSLFLYLISIIKVYLVLYI